jgi:hypothetical protein
MRNDGDARRRRLGRRLGIGAFALLVASFTAICSVEIILQVWAPSPGPAPASCRAGISDLFSALRRARAAAAQEPNGERAALTQFRQALLPEWDSRAALDAVCRSDAEASRALSIVTALRYAEEHAVRYEAVALAEPRRQMDALARSLLRSEPAF